VPRFDLYTISVATREGFAVRRWLAALRGVRDAASITEIYRSSNGDRWQRVRTKEPRTKDAIRVWVRHIPNPSCAGQMTDTTVADFLCTKGPGPGYAALRRLLESTAGEPGAA
jgi:hypothetical protein